MGVLKTKDAADLISVSQTTIKRWASAFPDFFPKDRFGHYIFTEHEIGLLSHIKARIDDGETLDRIDLMVNKQRPAPLQDANSPLYTLDPSLKEMLTRIEHVEHSLDQKADEVVSVQLLQQRQELEELRKMIQQVAASLETIQLPSSKPHSPNEELHLAAAAKHQALPKKRGLLRSFFT